MKCFYNWFFALLILLVSSFWGYGGFATAEVRGAQLDSMDESPRVSADEWRKLTYYYQGMETKGTKSSHKPFYYDYTPREKVFNGKGAFRATVFHRHHPHDDNSRHDNRKENGILQKRIQR